MKVKATISLLAGVLLLLGGGTASATTLGTPSPATSAAPFTAGGDTGGETGGDTDGPGTPTNGTDGDVTWGS